jgi:hypothetical protein
VGARLQRHRHGGAAQAAVADATARALEGDDLGVGTADRAGATAAQDAIAAEHHRTHRRIRKGAAECRARLGERDSHGALGRHESRSGSGIDAKNSA